MQNTSNATKIAELRAQIEELKKEIRRLKNEDKPFKLIRNLQIQFTDGHLFDSKTKESRHKTIECCLDTIKERNHIIASWHHKNVNGIECLDVYWTIINVKDNTINETKRFHIVDGKIEDEFRKERGE